MGSQRVRYNGVTEHQIEETESLWCLHVLTPCLFINHLLGQTQDGRGRKSIRLGVRKELGMFSLPSTSRWALKWGGPLTQWSLLPSTSQGLPSVNFACGQVHTQHALYVTLDLCLLFVIKRRNHQMSIYGSICSNEVFFFLYVNYFGLILFFFFFFTKRAANISWGQIRSCFNTVSFNWPWTESTNFLEVTSSSTLDTHSQINELRRFLFR